MFLREMSGWHGSSLRSRFALASGVQDSLARSRIAFDPGLKSLPPLEPIAAICLETDELTIRVYIKSIAALHCQAERGMSAKSAKNTLALSCTDLTKQAKSVTCLPRMADSTPSALSAKAQTPVNKEAVRMLVQDVGYQLASQKTGIKEATLRQWAKRGGWNKVRQHAQVATVTTVTKPADAQLQILSERKQQTKLHLSRYVAEASEEAANHSDKLKITGEAKDLASVSSHLWPEEKAEGSGVMGGLRVYSQQTVISVQGSETPAPQAP